MREETDYHTAMELFGEDIYVLLEPWGMSIDHFRLRIKGFEDTPYENGFFVFEIKIPETYPFHPPYCYCHTLIWHPNIDPQIPPGKINICLDLINPELTGHIDAQSGATGWTPSKTLSNIIEALKGMIHLQHPFFNIHDPLNYEAGIQAQNHWNKFIEKAKVWTKKYAMD